MPSVTGVDVRSMFFMFGRDFNVKGELWRFKCRGGLIISSHVQCNPPKNSLMENGTVTQKDQKPPPPPYMAGLGGPYRVKLNTLGDWRVHPLSIMWNIEIKLELYSTFWRGKPPCLVVSHMNYSMRSRLLTKCLTFDHKVPAKRFFKRCFIVLFYFDQFVNLFTSIETAVLSS